MTLPIQIQIPAPRPSWLISAEAIGGWQANASPDRTPLPDSSAADPWQINRALQSATTMRHGFACNCIGGENCCIKRAERAHEAAIRADERAKVTKEGQPMAGPWECPRCHAMNGPQATRCDCPPLFITNIC